MNLKFSQLKDDNPIPVEGSWLLIQGDEEYLKGQLLARLRGQLLAEGDEFNFETLNAAERWDGVVESAEQAKRERMPTRADKVLGLAQALPFLGSGRLLIVINADQLPADAQKKLAANVDTVPPMNHVLLVTGEAKEKKAARLAADLLKAIAAKGTVYDCSGLNEDEAAEWVRKTLKGWGQTIEPAALRALLLRAGTELRRLQIEVEKLSLMVGDSSVIRAQDVEMITPKLAEESVFKLADAVAARDAATALAVLRDLLEGQLEQPARIFPLVIRQFRLIWQTKVLLDAGWKPRQDPASFPKAIALLPEQNALSLIGGWMGAKLAGPARQMSWEQLQQAYRALLECDMAGKAIEGVPRQEMDIALEMLCVKLCASPGKLIAGGSRF